MEIYYTDFIHWLTLETLNEFYGKFRRKDYMRQENINEGFNF